MSEKSLVLYFAPNSRAVTALWMLEELGASYQLEVFNLKKGEHKSSAYLAVNPMGKVPAIKHRDAVVTEVAAICCYLADEFSEAGLAPPIGDPDRGAYLRWMFYAPSCVEPAMAEKAFQYPQAPSGGLGYGDFDTVMTVATQAISGRDYLLGERFSAADIVLGSTIRYGMMFGIFPKRPEFEAYTDRLTQRDAFKRMEARNDELAAVQDS